MTGLRVPFGRMRVAGAVALALMAVGAWAAPGANANLVYWANYSNNTISFADQNGAGAGTLNIRGTTLDGPSGVVLDPAAGKIYWANALNDTIGVANLDGTGGRTLNTAGATLSYPDGLVVDHANGKIYIANYNSSTITYANLDGSGGGGTLDITGASPSGPIGNLALDLSSGRLYWSNFSTGTISYANADGSGGGNVLPTTGATLSGSFGVAIDPALGRIYTANQSNNTLSFANLDGSGGGGQINTSGTTADGPSGVAIDPQSGRIWWANQFNNTISYANVDNSGGGVTINTTGTTLSNPVALALLDAPVGTGAPTITNRGSTTLSCSRGSWATDIPLSLLFRAPENYSYSWRNNGSVIPGATSSSITANSPGAYTCTVTATNPAGSRSQTSGGFSVVAASASMSPSTSGPSAQLTFTCSGLSGQTCSGGFAATAHETKRGSSVVGVAARKHKKKPKKVVLVNLGSGSYSVAAGGSQTISFRLNGTGKKLLSRLYNLPSTFTFSATSGTTIGPRTVKFFYTRITSNIQFSFAVVPATHPFTKFTQMTISGVPSGGSVTASCRGGGCPFGRITKKHKRTISLTPQFRTAHLSPGTKVQISITAPNSVGKVEILSTHAGAGPSVAKRCLPPGARKPLACA